MAPGVPNHPAQALEEFAPGRGNLTEIFDLPFFSLVYNTSVPGVLCPDFNATITSDGKGGYTLSSCDGSAEHFSKKSSPDNSCAGNNPTSDLYTGEYIFPGASGNVYLQGNDGTVLQFETFQNPSTYLLTATVYLDGTADSLDRDANGNALRMMNRANLTVATFTPPNPGTSYPGSVTDADGVTTSISPLTNGSLVITEPGTDQTPSATTALAFDGSSRLVAAVYPDKSTEEWGYNADNSIALKIFGQGSVTKARTTYTYPSSLQVVVSNQLPQGSGFVQDTALQITLRDTSTCWVSALADGTAPQISVSETLEDGTGNPLVVTDNTITSKGPGLTTFVRDPVYHWTTAVEGPAENKSFVHKGTCNTVSEIDDNNAATTTKLGTISGFVVNSEKTYNSRGELVDDIELNFDACYFETSEILNGQTLETYENNSTTSNCFFTQVTATDELWGSVVVETSDNYEHPTVDLSNGTRTRFSFTPGGRFQSQTNWDNSATEVVGRMPNMAPARMREIAANGSIVADLTVSAALPGASTPAAVTETRSENGGPAATTTVTMNPQGTLTTAASVTAAGGDAGTTIVNSTP